MVGGHKKGQTPTLWTALKKGGPMVWLSCLVMGLGNILAGQVTKGLLLFLLEICFLLFMFSPRGGGYYLWMLPSLGWKPMEEIYNEKLGIYEYAVGHNSQLLLLYGVATVGVVVAFLLVWRCAVTSGYRALALRASGKKPNTFRGDLQSLLDGNVHKLLMGLPVVCLVVFTIFPTIYMVCMAFTNYSIEGEHLVLFDWVGVDNFRTLLSNRSAVGRQFGDVLAWTIVWAVFATFLNFFFGTGIAILIERKGIRWKGFWRSSLSMTIAVPQFVSLLVMRSMLLPDGIINRMLLQAGVISERLPFLTNVTWARVLVILVNLWIGIPYTILQVTGILQNIPSEQYEAARIDGANPFQIFFRITLPYMLFVMTPYLITQFTGNINNFNVIYLLTRGEPVQVGNTAGATDLLVTWLYKLSVDQQKYNLGAVIGIFTFLVLAVVSLITYRNSRSYKDEEGFKT